MSEAFQNQQNMFITIRNRILFLLSAKIVCEFSELPKSVWYCHHVSVSSCDNFCLKNDVWKQKQLGSYKRIAFSVELAYFNTYWIKTFCGIEQFVKQMSQIFTVCPSGIYDMSYLCFRDSELGRLFLLKNRFKCFLMCILVF